MWHEWREKWHDNRRGPRILFRNRLTFRTLLKCRALGSRVVLRLFPSRSSTSLSHLLTKDSTTFLAVGERPSFLIYSTPFKTASHYRAMNLFPAIIVPSLFLRPLCVELPIIRIAAKGDFNPFDVVVIFLVRLDRAL